MIKTVSNNVLLGSSKCKSYIIRPVDYCGDNSNANCSQADIIAIKNAKAKLLFDKALADFKSLIEEYQYGNQVDESFIFEEVMFLKYLSMDCLDISIENSIIEFFLNNDYKTPIFKWMRG